MVACRNEVHDLRRCLEALALQDEAPHEVIVVDGASTDGSANVARAWGARLLADAGTGAGAARNLGIREARGDVVAFTDSDCAPRPEWLARVADVFAEDPRVAGVSGALRLPRDTFLGRMEDDDAQAYYRGFITSNVAYRRSVLMEVGGFDASLPCCEDYDLAWRVMDAGHLVVWDPRPVVVHAPPEVRGPLATYLRKQYWYARNDVLAQARALRRLAARPRGPAAAPMTRTLLPVAMDVATLASLAHAGLTRSRRSAVATLATTLVTSAVHAGRAARGSDAKAETPARLAMVAAKRLARAAGTVAGIAELATRTGRARLSAPARAPLPPASPAAPSARAAA